MRRSKILDVAQENQVLIGGVEETLKWGEPSYLPIENRIGTTVRIAWHAARPEQYAMYFNCKTRLIEMIRGRYGDIFTYEGNRALVLCIRISKIF